MNAICRQEITVSYTEDGVTRNASYFIDVLSEPTVYVDPTTLIGLVNGMGSNVFKIAGSVILYGIVSVYVFGILRIIVMGG